MNNFFKVPEMSQNRLIWVGIDLTSVPAKFGGPGSSRTVTITVPILAPKSRILWSKVGTKMEPSPCDGLNEEFVCTSFWHPQLLASCAIVMVQKASFFLYKIFDQKFLLKTSFKKIFIEKSSNFWTIFYFQKPDQLRHRTGVRRR